MNKETYTNGNIVLEVRTHQDGYQEYWVQCGVFGLMLSQGEVEDLAEMLDALRMELNGY